MLGHLRKLWFPPLAIPAQWYAVSAVRSSKRKRVLGLQRRRQTVTYSLIARGGPIASVFARPPLPGSQAGHEVAPPPPAGQIGEYQRSLTRGPRDTMPGSTTCLWGIVDMPPTRGGLPVNESPACPYPFWDSIFSGENLRKYNNNNKIRRRRKERISFLSACPLPSPSHSFLPHH